MDDGINLSMPVAPAYAGSYGMNNGGFGGGFGGDWGWIILILLLAGNGGRGNGFGGGEDEMSFARGQSYARGGRGGNRVGGRSNRGFYRGGSYEGGSYDGSYEGSYDDGMGGSYARGRGRNAKRDSMGRYSREGGYSRADGKQEYIEHMRDLMMDAPDEQTRQSIQRMISEMENQ